MLSSKKTFVFVSLALIFSVGSFFIFKKHTFADTEGVDDVLFISEIMTAGKDAEGKSKNAEEFIELYNPNDHEVSLSGWKIKRTTSTGGDGGYISSDLGSGNLKIPAFGYFLLVPKSVCENKAPGEISVSYLGGIKADNCYSNTSLLAENNSIALYKDSVEVDKVGWGNVSKDQNIVFEYPLKSPPAGESLERRIMDGKMQDTGNDTEDFLPQSIPTPKSSVVLSEENDSDFDDPGSADETNGGNCENPSGQADNQNQDSSGSGIDSGGAENSENDSNLSQQNSEQQNASQANGSSGESGGHQAIETKIIVNELMMNPEGDDGKLEFIELYNVGKNAVDISGWSLEDQVGSIGRFVFAQGTVLESKKYKVVYSSDTKLSLNNSGDGVILKDNTGKVVFKTPVSGEVKEEESYAFDGSSKWLWTIMPTTGSKNIIKEKEVKVSDSSNKNEDIVDEDKNNEAGDAEDEKLLHEEAYDFSDKVIISEVSPDPLGKDNKDGKYEWVEIFNGDDREVNLKGWFVDDMLEKGSKPFRFMADRIVPAQGYFVLSSEESKLLLNNSDEEINLLWPDQKTVDSVLYDKAKENYSYSLSSDGDWFWVFSATPGKENVLISESGATKKEGDESSYNNSIVFTEDDESETKSGTYGEVLGTDVINREEYTYATILDAKKMSLGSRVGLDGIVATPPGVFGENIFYLVSEDSSDGLQMFSYSGKVPALNIGDRIQVFGFISQAGGEKRLVLNDDFQIEKMSSDNLLEPVSLCFADINDGMAGNLAKIEGRVLEMRSGNLFVIGDESGNIKVYAKPDTGISFDNIKVGFRISVIGHISRTSAGYRILPRFESDIHFFENEFDGIIKEENTKILSARHVSSEWVRLFIILSSVIVLDWVRLRLRTKQRRGKI